MDNLSADQKELIIEINAEAERPICHFELLPTKLTLEKENTKILEFESLGCKIKNTKRFYIVNPTATGYDFEWKKIEDDINLNNFNNYFKCVT